METLAVLHTAYLQIRMVRNNLPDPSDGHAFTNPPSAVTPAHERRRRTKTPGLLAETPTSVALDQCRDLPHLDAAVRAHWHHAQSRRTDSCEADGDCARREALPRPARAAQERVRGGQSPAAVHRQRVDR